MSVGPSSMWDTLLQESLVSYIHLFSDNAARIVNFYSNPTLIPDSLLDMRTGIPVSCGCLGHAVSLYLLCH